MISFLKKILYRLLGKQIYGNGNGSAFTKVAQASDKITEARGRLLALEATHKDFQGQVDSIKSKAADIHSKLDGIHSDVADVLSNL